MASTLMRRPLPALVSLLALFLLTSLVWWRVLHRGGDTKDTARPCPSPTATQARLPAPSSITVQVLNSTTRPGIGAKARSTLVADGFRVPAAAKNDTAKKRNKIKSSAEIRFGPTGKQAAALLRYYFPGAAMITTTARTATIVVSLGTGYKQVAAAATVQAALKGDNVAVANSSPSPNPSASC